MWDVYLSIGKKNPIVCKPIWSGRTKASLFEVRYDAYVFMPSTEKMRADYT